ncbi:hypothetical protein ES708_25333 [subsurface metagenome]
MNHKTCVHHWHIDNQDIGTCQKCGKVKNFHQLPNGVDDVSKVRRRARYLKPPLLPGELEILLKAQPFVNRQVQCYLLRLWGGISPAPNPRLLIARHQHTLNTTPIIIIEGLGAEHPTQP